MTNKINSIDVSECVYLNKVVNEEPYCNIDEEHLYTCSSDENCYFKQLKRLQEKNKELKTYIQKMDKPEIKTIDSEIALKNIELQEENEELKEKIKDLDAMTGIFSVRLANKYKQALQRIRLIATELKYKPANVAYNIEKEIQEIIEDVLKND